MKKSVYEHGWIICRPMKTRYNYLNDGPKWNFGFYYDVIPTFLLKQIDLLRTEQCRLTLFDWCHSTNNPLELTRFLYTAYYACTDKISRTLYWPNRGKKWWNKQIISKKFWYFLNRFKNDIIFRASDFWKRRRAKSNEKP